MAATVYFSTGRTVSSLTTNEVSDFIVVCVDFNRCVSFIERGKNTARRFEILDTNTRQ